MLLIYYIFIVSYLSSLDCCRKFFNTDKVVYEGVSYFTKDLSVLIRAIIRILLY